MTPINPNLIGQRFGRLLAGEARRTAGSWFILCTCDCGTIKLVRSDHLRTGRIVSCGCYKREATIRANTKHGDCRQTGKATEYLIWVGMVKRCTNPNTKTYHRYGGRGITVCQRWLDSYEAFLEDVGRRPSPHHSIERINNCGNYGPTNVRWATTLEQNNNRRSNRFLEFNGKRQTIADWGRETGIAMRTLWRRHAVSGWSIEKTLTTPVRPAMR